MEYFKEFLKKTGTNLKKYIKASLLIGLINFIILNLGLKIGGVSHFFLISVFITLFDLLPLVGSIIILAPWAIFSYVNDNDFLALILVLIIILNLILEQVIRPIVQGSSVGIKPIYSIIINIVCAVLLSPVLGLIVGSLISVVLGVILDMRKIKDESYNSVR